MTRSEWLIFAERVKKAWDNIKQLIKYCADLLREIKEIGYHKQKWQLISSISLKSQVMDNKPKHLVKKVRM